MHVRPTTSCVQIRTSHLQLCGLFTAVFAVIGATPVGGVAVRRHSDGIYDGGIPSLEDFVVVCPTLCTAEWDTLVRNMPSY